MQHPPTLAPRSKPEPFAILPLQLAKNPQKMGHFPICMHMGASMWSVNTVTHKSIIKKILIWGLKGHDLCQLEKNLDMTISKRPNQLTQCGSNLVPPTM
jgi:hypothetical protein